MKNFIYKNFNNIYYNFLFLVVAIFFLTKLSISYQEILGTNKWAYSNLLINYSAGFVRRGLFGEIFINIHDVFNVSSLYFFTTIFFIAYFLQIFFFYKILEKYKNYKFFLTFVILSPALLLFYIYDLHIFLAKDVFINLAILFHVYIVNKKIDIQFYNKILYFLIFPILILNMMNHENQVFFLPFHCLITLYFFINKKKQNYNLKYIKPYIVLLIPIFILLMTSGSYEKMYIINDSIKEFGVTIPNQFAGNINLAIGGFVKWHFFYHSVQDFLRLFLSFTLSIFLIYVFFDYLVKNNILKIDKSLIRRYQIILLPSLIILIPMLDHGRNFHMLSMHIIAFYLLLEFNEDKLKNLFFKIKKNYFLTKFLILFIIFYLNFWYLPQGGGFTGIGNFSTMFKGTLTNELSNVFSIFYNFVDSQIINLPRIVL
tara:strand:- start:928 stop:2211 length:1284 start_codon:yes stop_codon:yes gene_type:complete